MKLKRILQFAKPYRMYLFGSLFFNLLYSVLQVFSVISMLPILNILFRQTESAHIAEAPVYDGELRNYFNYVKESVYYKIQLAIHEFGGVKVLAWLCGITAVAFLLRNLFRYLGSFLMVNYKVGVTNDLRTAMYRKFLRLPVSFFTEQRKGDMMSRISNDINAVETNVMEAIADAINAPFMIIGSLIMLFILDTQLTLFSLIVFPIMGFIISFVGKKLKKQAGYVQEELANIFSLVEETLKSGKIIKIFNADKLLQDRFLKTSEKWKKHIVGMSRKRELASPSSEFLGSITILLITWFAGVNIIIGNTNDPLVFLSFIGLFFQILEPAKKLSSAVSSVHSGMASLERVYEVLDYNSAMEESDSLKTIETINESIEFKNINFFYDNKQPILNHFNLKIPKGKKVALVGQSGSGKTTVANLLARFYDTNEGSIEIDGINIQELNLKTYRSLLGMVTQESVLFNDSIYNNILIGKPDASREEVITAAKIANAHQFISELSDGYDTNIGDDGNKLSGGQKQRISIARAVLKNPPIMILDEATSALDTESEKMVQDALNKMMENRTSLVIAHRLSTIQKADLILVMERGNIVEQGTHQELYKQNGIYRKLIELQGLN